MKYKGLILFVLFLFLLPIVLSVKPTQVLSGDVGLDIRVPQAEFIKLNERIDLNIHVFNRSNGLLMDNTTTECIIHLFNGTGSHLTAENMGYDEHDGDFVLDIDGNNFSVLGFHSFIIQCNTSDIGGFVSGSLRVTETGEDDSPNNIYPVIIGIIAIIIFFSILGYSQIKSNRKKFKVGLIIISFTIALVEIVNLAFMLYLHESAMSLISMLRINFWMLFIIVFGIGMISLAYTFLKALNLDDPMTGEDEEGNPKKWQGHK